MASPFLFDEIKLLWGDLDHAFYTPATTYNTAIQMKILEIMAENHRWGRADGQLPSERGVDSPVFSTLTSAFGQSRVHLVAPASPGCQVGYARREVRLVKRIIRLSLFVALFGVATTLEAASLAKISAFRGDVSVKPAGATATKPVKMKDSPLNEGDAIIVGKGIARVLYPDGSWFDVRKDTELVIKKGELNIQKGDITSKIAKGSVLLKRFRTPSGVAAVKGTVIKIQVDAAGQVNWGVIEGKIAVMTVKTNRRGARVANITLDTGDKLQVRKQADGKIRVRVLTGNVDLQIGDAQAKMNKDDIVELGEVSDEGKASVKVVGGEVEVTTSPADDGAAETKNVAAGENFETGGDAGDGGGAGGDGTGGNGTGGNGTGGDGTGTPDPLIEILNAVMSSIDEGTDDAGDDAQLDSITTYTNTGGITTVSPD